MRKACTGYVHRSSRESRGHPNRRRPTLFEISLGSASERASAGLLPPPALRERRHCLLAGGCIAVGRALNVVAAVPARPHPGAALGRSGWHPKDAADDLAVFEHIVVIGAPTRWVAALEDQRGHVPAMIESQKSAPPEERARHIMHRLL